MLIFPTHAACKGLRAAVATAPGGGWGGVGKVLVMGVVI